MKFQFKLIIEIEGGRLSNWCDSDAFTLHDLGRIVGSLERVSRTFNEQFQAMDAESRTSFNEGLEQGRKPPDNGVIGFQVVK